MPFLSQGVTYRYWFGSGVEPCPWTATWPRQVYPLGGFILIILTSALAPLPASFHSSVKPTGGARVPSIRAETVIEWASGFLWEALAVSPRAKKPLSMSTGFQMETSLSAPLPRSSQMWAYSLTCLKAIAIFWPAEVVVTISDSEAVPSQVLDLY